ncbi:MAG: amidohydrolase family protein [Planctomycetota bacterium]
MNHPFGSMVRTPAAGVGALAALLLSAALAAQADRAPDPRPIAFTNARILTMDGAPIERGTLVARNGRIEALGADVAAPAGARVVDCEGGTLMPGLVSAFARAGLVQQHAHRAEPQRGGRRGRRSAPSPGGGGGNAQNTAATRIADSLDPKQDVFHELLEVGITTLALTPPGDGFPGLGALLRPDGSTIDDLVLDASAFVFVGTARNASTKKVLKEGFAAAKKRLEERNKPKEPTPPAPSAEGKPADGAKGEAPAPKGDAPQPKPDQPQPDQPKPDQPKPDQPKPDQPKPDQPKEEPAKAPAGDGKPAAKEPEPDPNLEVLADLLEGKRRAVLQIDSAADLLHWCHATGKELAEFPRAVAATTIDDNAGTLDQVLDQLKALKAPVLLPPDLGTVARTTLPTHPVRALHRAGIEVGFVLGDDPDTVRMLFFRLMQLVRTGLPADAALRGVTLVPAKALGIDGDVGALAVGKKADLLLFTGDPLDPSSALRSVFVEGRRVEADSPTR